MAKIITRSEVNAIVEGTFSTDLTKAVLYGEVSGNPNFIVSAVNSVSQLNYTASQALLEVDIRRATSLIVTLTPRTTDILSTDTTIVFDITTGGTGTITSLEPVVVTRGGVDISANFSIAADGKTATLTFPQNTTFSPMEIDVQIKAVTMDGDFPSNTSVLYQNPASRLEFANSTSNQDSTATTTTQAFYNNNCTGVGVYSATTDTNATISGDHVIITFPENSGSNPVTRIVCISGITADNTTVYTYHTITQAAASPTGVDFRYSGYRPLSPAAGSISSSDFILTLTNAELTGCRGINGITPTTGGTTFNPTISATYDANTMPLSKNLTIAITATTIYGETITKSVVISQEGDTYTLSLSPGTNPVVYNATANTLTITSTNISDIEWDSVHSSGINSCSISTGTANVTFNQNTGASPLTKTVAITGMTRAGRTVSATTEFEQQGSVVFSIQYTGSPVESSAGTTNKFAITAQNANVTGFSVNNGAQVQASGSTSVTISYPANLDNDEQVTYTVTMLGSGSSGPLSTTCTFQQLSDGYTFELTPNENPVAFNSTSTTFAIASQYLSNIGWVSGDSVNVTSCTISNGNAVVGYSANSTTSTRPITVVVSGRTVGGRTVTASGTTTQEGKAEEGRIDVSIGSRQRQVGPSYGTNSFDVSWSYLKPGSTITLTGVSGMGSISPASIAVNNSGSGTSVVSFDYGPSSNTRILTLTASGIDNNDEAVSNDDYFQQYGDSDINVSAATSHVAYNTTVVIFNVSWTDVWGRINFSSNIGTLNYDYITANGSGSQEVRVAISINQSTTPRDITLTASPATFTVAGDSATTVQDGMATAQILINGSNYYTYNTNDARHFVEVAFPVTYSSINPASIGWSYVDQGNFDSATLSGSPISYLLVTWSENKLPTPVHSTVNVTGTSLFDGSVVTATLDLCQAARPQFIPLATEVYLDAYVDGTYDASWVSGSTIISYNDLTGFTVQVTSGNSDVLITSSAITTSSVTIYFICTVNETTSPIINKGIIDLFGNDKNGNVSHAEIRVSQKSGIAPFIKIEGETSYIVYLGNGWIDGEEFDLTWNGVNPSTFGYQVLSSGHLGSVYFRPNNKIAITVDENTQGTQVTSAFRATGTTVYGRTASAIFTAVQDAIQPSTTFEVSFDWYTPSSVPPGYSSGTRQSGAITYRINNGTPINASMTPQHVVSGVSSGSTINYTMYSAAGGNFLKYSGTVTVTGNTHVQGVAVPDAFVVNIAPYNTPDSKTNIFSIIYSTYHGATGTTTITCSGASGTTTISLGTGYTTTNSDYMSYTVAKAGGSINISGWYMSGTNGSASNVSFDVLNNEKLNEMSIVQGKPADITLRYNGTYPGLSGTINWDAVDATKESWKECDIELNQSVIFGTTNVHDTGTFYYSNSSDTFECSLSGGIGDGQAYRNHTLRIMSSNGDMLFSGSCALIYRFSQTYQGVILTAAQLNGSTWYLSDNTE